MKQFSCNTGICFRCQRKKPCLVIFREFKALDKQVRQALDEAVEFAESGHELPPERLHEDLYVD